MQDMIGWSARKKKYDGAECTVTVIRTAQIALALVGVMRCTINPPASPHVDRIVEHNRAIRRDENVTLHPSPSSESD